MSFQLHQKQGYTLSPLANQKWGHLRPPSYQSLERKYSKTKSVHIRKMYTRKYGQMKGERGVFASENMRKRSIVAISNEGLYFHTNELNEIEKLREWNHVREYCISFDMPTKEDSVGGLGEWNFISIHDSIIMTCNDGKYGIFKDKETQVNARFVPRFINEFPFIFIKLTKTVIKSDQIYVCYGLLWWKVTVTCPNCNQKMKRQAFVTHQCTIK